MNIGFHHFHYKLKHAEKEIEEEKIKLRVFVDKAVYAISALAVLVLLPQTSKIWMEQNATGLSLVSWVGILIGTSFWLTYGLIHKVKPIIIANSALIVMDFLIVLGILIYS